jgi:hypothetical protein
MQHIEAENEVSQSLRDAVNRGVKVRITIDRRKNKVPIKGLGGTIRELAREGKVELKYNQKESERIDRNSPSLLYVDSTNRVIEYTWLSDEKEGNCVTFRSRPLANDYRKIMEKENLNSYLVRPDKVDMFFNMLNEDASSLAIVDYLKLN